MTIKSNYIAFDIYLQPWKLKVDQQAGYIEGIIVPLAA